MVVIKCFRGRSFQYLNVKDCEVIIKGMLAGPGIEITCCWPDCVPTDSHYGYYVIIVEIRQPAVTTFDPPHCALPANTGPQASLPPQNSRVTTF